MPTSATPVQLVDPDTGTPYKALPSNTDASQTGTNSRQVQGNTGSATSDSGNPVKVGGRVTTTGMTFTNGQRADLQMDANGGVATYLKVPGVNIPVASPVAPADNESINNYGITTYSRGQVFNGTGWDKQRGDTNGTFVISKGGASIATGQVNVTTSSTLVAAARAGRQKITLSPTSNVVYYVGNSGVTTTTGVYVAAGASITLDTAAAVYAVGAAAVTISYIEFY